MKKILFIEDDRTFLMTMVSALESENFQLDTAENGNEGLRTAIEGRYDLIILDWVLPGMNGIDVCRKLRAHGKQTPIIILSGKKKEEIDKVLGLELGADDYLIKPFGAKELIARIHAILRRTAPEEDEIEEITFGDVTIHFKKQTAFKDEQEIHLTAKEFKLLKLLVQHEGEVVDRDTILNEVWGYDIFPTTRTVDTFMHNLRKKIENNPSQPRYLITVHWTGYKFMR